MLENKIEKYIDRSSLRPGDATEVAAWEGKDATSDTC